MKRVTLGIVAASLSACGFIKTNEVSGASASRVPTDRVFAYQSPGGGMAAFMISRDTGMLGGGCFLAVEIDRKLAARFDTGEAATFYVKPGRVELSVVGDPQGQGLCGLGFSPVREAYQLPADKTTRFRLSSRAYRRPELESNDVEPIDKDAKVPVPSTAIKERTAPSEAPTTASMTPSKTAPALPAAPAPVAPAPQVAGPAQPLPKPNIATADSKPSQLKYQYSAETLAKSRRCSDHPMATLVASGAGSETYSIRCDSGETIIERCDFGNCRVLE